MSLAHKLRNNGITTRLRYGRLALLWNKLQPFDDFDWEGYNRNSYRHEMARDQGTHVTRLPLVRFSVDGNRIVLPDGQRLHPTHQVIYETVLELRPASVFECGFGGGDHLLNLLALMPGLKVAGADIGEAQRQFALERNPELRDWPLQVLDMTQPIPATGVADFVYCNAVIMHIHGRGRHKQFIKNMVQLSKRFVLLRENWLRHDFSRDVRGLYPELKQYRVERAGAIAMLLDKHNALNLPEITGDDELRNDRLVRG